MYEKLAWDTQILGLSVARLVPDKLNTPTLGALLSQLKADAVRLVYWCAQDTPGNSEAATAAQGYLADDKRTYLIDLSQNLSLPTVNFEYYSSTEPEPCLLNMAVEIGSQSRFGKDPLLTEAQMTAVYHKWMINSCHKQAADAVLVIRDKGKIAAMATVKMKDGRGDIPLLAVAAPSRGLGFGRLITLAAQTYFKSKGLTWVQVVTQRTNFPACQLYEKCGFRPENDQKFYHFWL